MYVEDKTHLKRAVETCQLAARKKKGSQSFQLPQDCCKPPQNHPTEKPSSKCNVMTTN